MRTQGTGLPKLEVQGMLSFQTYSKNLRSNKIARAELDVSEVLLFHEDSRNYENQNHSITEARIQRNAIIS